MKKYTFVFAALFILTTSATVVVSALDKIGEGYAIKFESKDPTGTFDVMEGKIEFDEKNLSASYFDLKFPVSSINTANTMRDKKAQTSEWFDAAKYPYVAFKSSSIEKKDKGYTVKGTLTIKGISKSYSVPLLVKPTGDGKTIYGTFGVNRIDFKVGKPNGTVPDVMNIKYIIPLKN